MKVGSLVECIRSQGTMHYKPLVYGNIYTIREIETNRKGASGVGVLLEEITNEALINGLEPSYCITRFREVQPPMDLTNLMEEVYELELINN